MNNIPAFALVAVLAVPVSAETALSVRSLSSARQARAMAPVGETLAIPKVQGARVSVKKAATEAPKALPARNDRGVRFQVRDWESCVDGWMDMDITVLVDGERHGFRPSCDFYFSRSFTTQKNKRCQVRAGMCSSFHPENRFEVRCDGGAYGEIGIPCKDDSDDGVKVEPDWKDCIDGWISMDVKVTVGEEAFDFSPSCDFSFSETFESKAGGTCRAESGMCTNWHPRNKFEVVCDKGPSGWATIPCKD